MIVGYIHGIYGPSYGCYSLIPDKNLDKNDASLNSLNLNR